MAIETVDTLQWVIDKNKSFHDGGSRPALLDIYMDLAFQLAKRSTCSRLQVGSVVCSPDFRQIYAVGYNGGAKGLENDCKKDPETGEILPGNCGHAHAEDNSCNYAPAEIPKYMIVTHQPCEMCAIRIINKGGFKGVFYSIPYRLDDGLRLLYRAKIPVDRVDTLYSFVEAAKTRKQDDDF